MNYSSAEETKPSTETIDDFLLLDQHGISHQLYYYSDQKAIVLISHGIGCPIMRQSIPELNLLQDQYRSKGVVFLMINGIAYDDRQAVLEESSEYKIQIPILQDKSQVITESLGFTRISEVMVIDPRQWKIIYQGPLDDRLNYETQKKNTTVHYLKDVLDDVLLEKTLIPKKIHVKGCLIRYPSQDEVKKISYSNDIVPILVKSCVPCHTPGGVAPWSMDNYKKVKGWSSMIREVVRTRRMPPWQADNDYGVFSNDISLTDEEKGKLIRWIDNDSLRGESADNLVDVKRPLFKDWSMGAPDLIFTFDKERVIPPTGFIPYQVVPADKPVEKDLWIRAVDLRPGNLRVVHHCDVAVVHPDEIKKDQKQDRHSQWSKNSGMAVDGVGQIVAGYAPGYDNLLVFPEDTGLFIPKGSKLNFWMHYITTGKEERDSTKFGVYLYRGSPSRVYSVVQVSNKALKIQPGEKHFQIRAEHVFEKDVQIASMTAHMHYRGHSMKITAEYPDGNSEVLLSVPHFKFNWQRRYLLKTPKSIPAGTKILVDGVFDNSAQNPDNPDPKQLVQYGSRSEDEMFSAFIAYTTANVQ